MSLGNVTLILIYAIISTVVYAVVRIVDGYEHDGNSEFMALMIAALWPVIVGAAIFFSPFFLIALVGEGVCKIFRIVRTKVIEAKESKKRSE